MIATINSATTLYPNALMEYRIYGGTLTKYYHADGRRIAMREGSTLYYFVSDHPGSTALTLNQNGTLYSKTRYKPFGETAWSNAPADESYSAGVSATLASVAFVASVIVVA